MGNIPYDLLIRYCRKEATPEEILEAEEWLSDSSNYSVFLELEKEWLYAGDETLVIPDKETTWQNIRAGMPVAKVHKKKTSFYRIAAAASILVVLGSILTLLLLNDRKPTPAMQLEYTTISAHKNEINDITLSDGTSVCLNSGASIVFDNSYNTTTREVSLDGEIYIEVKPSGKKFVVEMGEIKIQVLGTSFNVKAYRQEQDVEISLKEGKIAVVESVSENVLFEMEPLQTAVINRETLGYTVVSEKAYYHDIWKERSLSVYDESLEILFKKLEAWYGVKIHYVGLDTSGKYTFNLSDESLTEFLELFSGIEPIEYRIEGNDVYVTSLSGY